MNNAIIFVYGTLRKGFHNHKLLSFTTYLGTAKTAEKYTMYTSGIPFVNCTPAISQIAGELYSVSDECLSWVDNLESYNPNSPETSWYVREEIDVIIESGEKQKASIYFNDKNKGRIVCSGDYALPLDDDSQFVNYFAYGSNINIGRMLDRVGEFSYREPAILKNHRFVYNKNAYTLPPSTYANAVIEQGQVTAGYLYKIPLKGLKTLDLREGVAINHYYRKEVEVITLDGPEMAFAYFACDNVLIEGVEPSDEYRKLCEIN